MVIGGWYDPFRDSRVEIIDLANPSASCPYVQPYANSKGTNRLTATYLDGKVLACGGLVDAFGAQQSCFLSLVKTSPAGMKLTACLLGSILT